VEEDKITSNQIPAPMHTSTRVIKSHKTPELFLIFYKLDFIKILIPRAKSPQKTQGKNLLGAHQKLTPKSHLAARLSRQHFPTYGK